jgi:hypothetical protein
MKNYRLLLALGITVGFSSLAHATCTGAGDPCNDPRNGAITAHSATRISMSVQNSATPNPTNSVYYFQATTLGSPQNSGTLDRNTVVVFTNDFGPGLATDVVGQTVQPLLANTNYHGYAKVCPPGSSLPTDAGCSSWVSIGSQLTDVLTNAGFSNIAPADTQPLQFTARTNSSVVDQTNVIAWLATNLNSTEVGNCALGSASVQPFPPTGTASQTITSADCATIAPNRPYTLVEHLVYDPTQTAPNYTTSVFWTQAATPGAHASPIIAVTHVTARVQFLNGSGGLANPTGTDYTVTFTASGGTTKTVTVKSTTGNAGEVIEAFTEGLSDGKNYTATVIAQNRGGGSWRDSSALTISNINTLPWSLTLTVPPATVFYTSATANIAVGDTSGLSHYYVRFSPLAEGAKTNWPAGNSTDVLKTGLTPNTNYTVTARLCEQPAATEYCSGQMPATSPPTFTTDVFAPTAGSLTGVQTRQMTANWTDASANPNTSVYEIEHCTTGFGTGTCVQATQTKVAGSAQTKTITGLSPNQAYFVRVRTRSAGRTTWPDSAWFDIGTATTLADVSSIQITPGSANLATGNTQTFTATVKDDLGNVVPGAAVNWSVNGGGSLSTNNGVSTVFTATSAGSFTLTATRTGIVNNGSASITIVNSGIQITQSPTITLNADGVTGHVSVRAIDNVLGEPSIKYKWELESGPSVVNFSPNETNAAKDATATFTAAGTYVLRVTMSNTNGSTFALTPSTTVVQVLNQIKVTPTDITVSAFEEKAFTATGYDQFNNPMVPSSLSWNTTGGGNVSAAGVFSSPTIGQRITVTARSGSVAGAANVNVISYDLAGAYAYPVPFKSSLGTTITFTGLNSQAKIKIYTSSGRLVYSTEVTTGSFPWDVKNSSGEKMASGVYFYTIESPTQKKDGKLIIIQ